jgi:hypothetical protein
MSVDDTEQHKTPEGDFDATTEPSSVTCLACGGQYDGHVIVLKPHKCDWCTTGTMNAEQIIAWKARAR